MKSFIKKYPIFSYLLMTFILAWIIVFILLATSHTDMSSPSLSVILGGWLLGFAPALSAFTVTYITEGTLKKSTIIRSLKIKNHASLYLLSLIIVPLYTLLTIFLTHLLIAPYKIQLIPQLIILGFTWGIFSAFGEEPGWRGFLFPHLLKKYTFFQSAILIGIIWAIWHLPMNYIDCRFYGDYMLSFMVVACINLILDALIISGLYIKGKGDLKLTMLYHYTLTGSTILQGAFCQPLSPSCETTLYSNYLGFVFKIIIAALILYSIRNQLRIVIYIDRNNTTHSRS